MVHILDHSSDKEKDKRKLFLVPYFIKLLKSEYYLTYRGTWFSFLFHVFTGTL